MSTLHNTDVKVLLHAVVNCSCISTMFSFCWPWLSCDMSRMSRETFQHIFPLLLPDPCCCSFEESGEAGLGLGFPPHTLFPGSVSCIPGSRHFPDTQKHKSTKALKVEHLKYKMENLHIEFFTSGFLTWNNDATIVFCKWFLICCDIQSQNSKRWISGITV
jgi:hypothetical protein